MHPVLDFGYRAEDNPSSALRPIVRRIRTPTHARIRQHSRRVFTVKDISQAHSQLRIISTLCGLVAQSVEQRTADPF